MSHTTATSGTGRRKAGSTTLPTAAARRDGTAVAVVNRARSVGDRFAKLTGQRPAPVDLRREHVIRPAQQAGWHVARLLAGEHDLLRDEALQQARLPGWQHCGLVSLPRTAEPVCAAAAVQVAAVAGLLISAVRDLMPRPGHARPARGEVLLG
ncbi:MAG TPA: hypothetical protein VMA72_10560 [Streptosporangiaceae bacterium]|nr:hypothetical protein [Streptosporangiaceae bacterium]